MRRNSQNLRFLPPQTSDWERQLNEGDETVRHTWRLVFASTSKDLEKARKTGTGGGNVSNGVRRSSQPCFC